VFEITRIDAVGTDLQLNWKTVATKSYQLQRSPTPDNAGPWTNLGSTTFGTGGDVMQTDVGAATNTPPQFYRVRLLP